MKEETPKKKTSIKNMLLRLLALLVTAALILGALFLVVNWDRYNLDAIKRRLALRAVETNASGEAEPFTHGGGSDVSFAYLSDGILMTSNTGIHYYAFSGQQYAEKVMTMEYPILAATDSAAVAYDAGGQSLYLYQGGEETFTLTLEGAGDLLSARLNDNGWLAVTAQESGYKGTVTVYNSSYERVFRLNRSSTFVVDAMVSPDCKSVAVVTVGQQNGRFESQLLVYPLNSEEPVAQVSLGSGAVLELDYESSQIWLLSESSLTTVSTADWSVESYSFGSRYLKGCTFDGDGFALLLLGRYRAGSADEVLVLSPEAEVIQTLPVQGQVLSFDAAGSYLCLLAGGELCIYTKDLEHYRTLEDVQGARYVALGENGSAMLADRQQAWLYIPG